MSDPFVQALAFAVFASLVLGALLLLRGRALVGSLSLIVALFLAFGLGAESLGQPKPIGWEKRCSPKDGTAALLSFSVEEPTRILLWLVVPGCGHRLYETPFDRRAAEALQKASRSGDRVSIGPDDSGGIVIHAHPQPPPPPKDETE